MPHRIAEVDFYAGVEQQLTFFSDNHKVYTQRASVIAVDEPLQVVDEAVGAALDNLPGKESPEQGLQCCLRALNLP